MSTNKIAYVAVSYQHHHSMHDVIQAIKHRLTQQRIDCEVFVHEFKFSSKDQQLMMQTACFQIQHSDFLIAEISHKAIGIGIEVGYAHALEKPILYLCHASSEISTTVSGIVQCSVVYHDTQDLKDQLFKKTQEILLSLSD